MRRACTAALLVATVAGLSAAGAAELEVVDREGLPVAGARVEVWTVPATGSVFELVDARIAQGESDADGRVSLPVPRAGELLLVVDAAAHPPLLVPVSSAPPVRVSLPPGQVLAGRARHGGESPEPSSGRACARWTAPLPGLGRDRTWERCAELSATGEFSIAGLPGAAVELTVEMAGFLPARREAAPGGDPLVVALEPGVRISGTVVGERGRPLAGATVAAGPDFQTQTGEDGSFLLAVPALPAELTVEADGYLDGREAVPEEAASREPVIHLVKGQVLTGELLGDGEPIEEATFRIHRHEGDSGSTAASRTETLDEGRFRLAVPEPGLYRLRIQAEGYRETVVPELEIGPGEELDLGVLVPSRGAGVRGRLVDEVTGELVAGGVVALVGRGTQVVEQALRGSASRAVSDEDGGFLLTGLEGGAYDLRAQVDGRAPALLEVDLGQDEVLDVGELVLGEGVRVLGRVSDRGGSPRPGVAVAFYQGDGDSFRPLAELMADGDGRFDGPLLSPGTYQVRVRAERQLLVQRVEVPEGVDRHELDLVAGGVSLRGVVTRDGVPVEGGLLVFASQLDPGLRRGMILLNTGGGLHASQSRFNVPESETVAEVGPDGAFVVEDAPVGRLVARYFGQEGPEVTRRVDVPDDAEAWVVIEVGGAELVGTVVDAETESGLEASLRLLASAGAPAGVTASGTDGRFRFSDLEPGSYRLEVSAPGYRPRVAADVRVAPGQAPLLVRLEAGGSGSLAVRLHRADGSALSRVQLTVLDASGVMVRSLLSDWNGEKVFRGLAEGEYVVVWADGLAGTGASPPIRVVAGETASYGATLPPAAPVSLRCEPTVCGGGSLELLQVLVPAGYEITPYLAGAHVGMRFSDGGRLALGRLTPGRYLVRAVAAGLRAERLLDVQGGDVVVSLE